jgi:hypothetical protein
MEAQPGMNAAGFLLQDEFLCFDRAGANCEWLDATCSPRAHQNYGYS